MFFDSFLNIINSILSNASFRKRISGYKKKYNIQSNVLFGNGAVLDGPNDNIQIGAGTYFNSGLIQCGSNSRIVIGNNCAIGYNVNILSVTHNSDFPTGPNRQLIEASIVIGNDVWIGSNVFIKEGVTIGNNVIVGANAVVTKSFGSGTIIGGIPAKIIKNKHYEN
jgi:maltose O-acetyltransferase